MSLEASRRFLNSIFVNIIIELFKGKFYTTIENKFLFSTIILTGYLRLWKLDTAKLTGPNGLSPITPQLNAKPLIAAYSDEMQRF
jgi:hypothetical protein